MKCIAFGCENDSKAGHFVDELCSPCYHALCAGFGIHGTSILFTWPKRIRELEGALRFARDMIDKLLTPSETPNSLTPKWP